ncbi:hypothetical protein SAMN05518670_3734 [Paenibacillus sp. OK076]|nr:hypothetical protein SAMN05518670_3734 [Paenibacillus sp. OK076]
MTAKGSKSDPAFRILARIGHHKYGPLGGTHMLQTFSVREGTLTGGGQHAINAAGHTQQGIFPTLARV